MCGKRVTRLHAHMNKYHLGLRPYTCKEPGCTSTYTDASHLINHEVRAHGRVRGTLRGRPPTRKTRVPEDMAVDTPVDTPEECKSGSVTGDDTEDMSEDAVPSSVSGSVPSSGHSSGPSSGPSSVSDSVLGSVLGSVSDSGSAAAWAAVTAHSPGPASPRTSPPARRSPPPPVEGLMGGPLLASSQPVASDPVASDPVASAPVASAPVADPSEPVSVPANKRVRRPRGIRRWEVAAAQGYNCAGLCMGQLPSCFHVDHIVAVAMGGDNEADNLQALCPNCHECKSSREREAARQQGWMTCFICDRDHLINERCVCRDETAAVWRAQALARGRVAMARLADAQASRLARREARRADAAADRLRVVLAGPMDVPKPAPAPPPVSENACVCSRVHSKYFDCLQRFQFAR